MAKNQLAAVHISTSEEQTKLLAEELARAQKLPAVITLSGELGAGKTAFCKGVARALGIHEKQLKSPTYTFLRHYTFKNGNLTHNLYHCDFYRIEHPDDLIAHDLNDILHQQNTLVLIEWPERVKQLLTVPHTQVTLEYINPTTRSITIGNLGMAF